MADQRAGAKYAQHLSAMAVLEEQTESLEVDDVDTAIDSVASGEDQTAFAEEGDTISTEDPQSPEDGEANNTSLATAESSSNTDHNIVKSVIEEAKDIEEDKVCALLVRFIERHR